MGTVSENNQPTLSINTSIQQHNSTPSDPEAVAHNGLSTSVDVVMTDANNEVIDGNESEDSAMLESPISDKEDGKTPFN